MKKIISLLSLCFVTISQGFASTISLTVLTNSEIKIIKENIDGESISFSEEKNEFIIDDELEKELRKSGVLKSQEAVKSTVCTGGGH